MTNLFGKILKKKGFILMAEIKIKSPSRGVLGKMSDIETIASEYEKGGADLISVVVNKKHFGGNMYMITRIKRVSKLPLFAKDFITSPGQIEKIKKAGADAILLLTKFNQKEKLKELFDRAEQLGLTVVVEIDNETDLQSVIKASYPVIAVNARNLNDFSIDRKKAGSLLRMIPKNVIALAFSGVRNSTDIRNYRSAGAAGVLVGTALMKSKNREEMLLKLTKT